MGNLVSMPTQEFTAEQVRILQNQYDLTNEETALFVQTCIRTGLDPFGRQIYAQKRRDNKTGKDILSIPTTIDGLRLIAERSGKYRGQQGPYWCGPNGKWVDAWISKDTPVAAMVGVLREDFAEPMWAVARYDSYVQFNYKNEIVINWRKMPDIMLAKCAEAMALRKCFPNLMSGLYTGDEMGQADNPEEKPAETHIASQPPTRQAPPPARPAPPHTPPPPVSQTHERPTPPTPSHPPAQHTLTAQPATNPAELPLTVGVCPVCSEEVTEKPDAFSCTCGFSIPKTKNHPKLGEIRIGKDQAASLLNGEPMPIADGYSIVIAEGKMMLRQTRTKPATETAPVEDPQAQTGQSDPIAEFTAALEAMGLTMEDAQNLAGITTEMLEDPSLRADAIDHLSRTSPKTEIRWLSHLLNQAPTVTEMLLKMENPEPALKNLRDQLARKQKAS